MHKHLAVYELVEIIKNALERDERVKICYKYQADKALQIQLHNGESFNLCVVKLDEKSYRIKRNDCDI